MEFAPKRKDVWSFQKQKRADVKGAAKPEPSSASSGSLTVSDSVKLLLTRSFRHVWAQILGASAVFYISAGLVSLKGSANFYDLSCHTGDCGLMSQLNFDVRIATAVQTPTLSSACLIECNTAKTLQDQSNRST